MLSFFQKPASILLSWLVLPLGMFLVGKIFENRTVPIWKDQSKMFFPGDFSLGLLFYGLANSITKKGILPIFAKSHWYYTGITITTIIIFFILRKKDARNLSSSSLKSPTKIYHDITGYIISIWVVLYFSIIDLYLIITTHKLSFTKNSIIVVLSCIFYTTCTLWDFTHPATRAQALHRHPEQWSPIWKN